MSYLPYAAGGAAAGYLLGRRRRGRRAPVGLCFPWALAYITKHPDALLMQGKVQEPMSSPPKWYWHGWIVHNGRVKDWQTMEAGIYPRFKKDGWPVALWMEMHTPRHVEEYDTEEAWAACRAAGKHAGPWHGPLSVGEKRPSAFDPSWANRGRRAASDPKVTAGKLQFYRGGKGALRPGPAYFTSGEWLAKMYGPVKKHRLYLRNPKFVTDAEWGGFDSISLRLDPSPAHRLRAKGYDSAVWIKETAQGPLYNVYALAGTDAIKKPKTQPRKRRSAATKIKWGTTHRGAGVGASSSLYQFGSLPDAWYLFRLEKLSDFATYRWRAHHKQFEVGVYRLRVSAPEYVKDLKKNGSYASTLGIGPLKEMRKLAQKYVDEGGGPIAWSPENWEKWHRIEESWGR